MLVDFLSFLAGFMALGIPFMLLRFYIWYSDRKRG